MKTNQNFIDWPHAPVHRLAERGAFIVTAATCRHEHFLNTPERLEYFNQLLFDCALEFGWELQAWAVLINHYHFVALSPADPQNLRILINKLHAKSALQWNRADGTPGRSVWFQYWETEITFKRSYFSRLNYVHQNPVHHGLVEIASEYAYCSAAWFERNASPAFRKMVYSFKFDKIKVPDQF